MKSHLDILRYINAEIEREEEIMVDTDRPESDHALGARDALAKFRMWLTGDTE